MTARELEAHGVAVRDEQVAALLAKVDAGCAAAGGPLDEDSPESHVMRATIYDLAGVFGFRFADCLPFVAFHCPHCTGSATIRNVIGWSCADCRRTGTRFSLALIVLQDPELLADFLAAAPSVSNATNAQGSAA